MAELSGAHKAALLDIFAIALERAAASVSEMVNEQVGLTVPRLDFLPAVAVHQVISLSESAALCGVSQQFNGPFHAEALLLFTQEQSLDMVRLIMDQDCREDELPELEAEALEELGNVLFYACMGSIGNLTKSKFVATLPKALFGTGQEVLRVAERSAAESVLFVYLDFTIAARTLKGFMVFLMEPASIEGLAHELDRYLLDHPA